MTDTPYTPEDLAEAETSPKPTGVPATEDDADDHAANGAAKPSEERKDELLESDLENTFPASDPVTPKHIT